MNDESENVDCIACVPQKPFLWVFKWKDLLRYTFLRSRDSVMTTLTKRTMSSQLAGLQHRNVDHEKAGVFGRPKKKLREDWICANTHESIFTILSSGKSPKI